MNYAVGLSTFGILREAGGQLENISQCGSAIERFNRTATGR